MSCMAITYGSHTPRNSGSAFRAAAKTLRQREDAAGENEVNFLFACKVQDVLLPKFETGMPFTSVFNHSGQHVNAQVMVVTARLPNKGKMVYYIPRPAPHIQQGIAETFHPVNGFAKNAKPQDLSVFRFPPHPFWAGIVLLKFGQVVFSQSPVVVIHLNSPREPLWCRVRSRHPTSGESATS